MCSWLQVRLLRARSLCDRGETAQYMIPEILPERRRSGQKKVRSGRGNRLSVTFYAW